MGVDGLEASLDLWIGTFTGREVASIKSVIRFLKMISECIGRNSGPEDDSEDLLEEFGDIAMLREVLNDGFKEDVDEYMDEDASAGLIGFLRYSNIVTCICILYCSVFSILGVRIVLCCLG